MNFSYILIIFYIYLLPTFFQVSDSTKVLVDGVSEWKNPSVHVGDSIIFQHKYHYNLYIFKNQRAFNLCNFTQATQLNTHNSTFFTWHPSRPGYFYFTFNNGSLTTCEDNQKMVIKVNVAISPELAPQATPAPTSGGAISSSPAYPWPIGPREADSPSSAPSSTSHLLPDKGEGLPFINSNPAVPLPTGEVDSTTISPLATSSHEQQVVVGFLQVHMALFCVVMLLL